MEYLKLYDCTHIYNELKDKTEDNLYYGIIMDSNCYKVYEIFIKDSKCFTAMRTLSKHLIDLSNLDKLSSKFQNLIKADIKEMFNTIIVEEYNSKNEAFSDLLLY